MRRRRRRRVTDDPIVVAHLATIDMTLELLLGAQLDAAVASGATVLAISAPGPFVGAIERRGVRHVRLSSSTRGWDPFADLRAAGELWRILRCERPTILHTHNPKPGLYGRVVGRFAGVPVVINTVHGLYATPDQSPVRRAAVYAAEALAATCSDAELVQNIEDVETMQRFRIARRRKVVHLGNGVDLARFRPGRPDAETRRALRASWGADESTVVIGAVGRLVAEKGVLDLLDACTPPIPGVCVVVVGGPDPDKPDSVEPDGRAVFLGHRADVDVLLGALDVFVLASWREGQPRAAMEAAATGLPVIATDVRGCRQVVDAGVTGLLVPPRQPVALRRAIETLAASAEVRSAFGTAGRAKAEREFDERAVVATVQATYARLTERIQSTVARNPLSKSTGSMPGNNARSREQSAWE